MNTLKALSALLGYPTEALIEALPEIDTLLDAEYRFSKTERAQLRKLMAAIGQHDLLDVQESYVEIFDRGRATALHLFEHVHGESRDRGQAMVDLQQVYARAGLELAAHELPDYLPAMLEYLSLRPFSETQDMLVDCAHILRSIGDNLVVRQSLYSAVFGALLRLIGEKGLSGVVTAPVEEKTLDEEWEEAPAFDGVGCAKKQVPKEAVIRVIPRAA